MSALQDQDINTKTPRKIRTRRDRSLGLLRAGGLTLVLLAVATGFGAHKVHAKVRETAFDVGRELAPLAGMHASTTALSLNGQRAYVSAAATDLSVHDVLDRVAGECDDPLANEFGNLGEALAAKSPKGKPARAALREEATNEGVLGCFAATGDKRPLLERANAFLKTGNLSEMGHLRYAYARREKEGGPTVVVAAWSDGPLNIRAMFPKDGDAQGDDSALTPRPAGSRRLMSARMDGHPHTIRMYEAMGTKEQVLASFDHDMAERGWTFVTPPKDPNASASAEADQTVGRGYIRKEDVQVMASVSESGDKGVITVVEMGRGPESALDPRYRERD